MEVIVHFLNGNDLLIQSHYQEKNYRDDIILEIDNMFYEVYFYTDGNMKYEMRKDFFALPGLIVLEDITNDMIYSALNQLIELNYFNNFKGKTIFPLNRRFQDTWYDYRLEGWESYNLCTYKLR